MKESPQKKVQKTKKQQKYHLKLIRNAALFRDDFNLDYFVLWQRPVTLTIWMPSESSSGLLRSLKAKRSVLSQSMEMLWRYWSASVSQTCRRMRHHGKTPQKWSRRSSRKLQIMDNFSETKKNMRTFSSDDGGSYSFPPFLRHSSGKSGHGFQSVVPLETGKGKHFCLGKSQRFPSLQIIYKHIKKR